MKGNLSAILLLSLVAGASASIGVGDKAPLLKVASYVEGGPVRLAKGTHVVEFWATWCGPCKMSIPHLTQLAKEFKGKVDFTGVSVYENGDNQLGQVKSFVKSMGPKMAYNVAFDGSSKYMAKNWMEAANQNGIPTAFVVKDGVILWIGHPMDGLEETLTKVAAGKFSVAAAKKEFAAKQEAQKAEMQAQSAQQKELQPYMDAVKAGDLPGQVKALNEFEAKHPELKSQVDMTKAMPLISLGEKEGYDIAKQLTADPDKDKLDFQLLNQIAWTIVQPSPAAKNPDCAFALALAKRAVDASKGDPMIMDTYALALFKTGDKAKAIETETKAVEGMKKMAGVDPAMLKDTEGRLESFKKS